MNKRLRQTEKWIKDKPELIANLCVYIALNSNNIFRLRQVKRNTDFLDADLPNTEQWHSYYNKFNLVASEALSYFLETLRSCGANLDFERGAKIIDSIKNPSENLKNDLKNINESDLNKQLSPLIPIANDFIRLFLLNNFEFDPEQSEMAPQNKMLLENQGMLFILCVLVPCMLEFQATPNDLFKQAVRGNYDALEFLVKLDKNIITHPQVTPIWTKLASNPTSYHFKRISKSISSKPDSAISIKKNKINGVAVIELALEFCNEKGWTDFKLKRTELFNLFDIVSSELEAKLCDYDLPESPEARDRAVNREKKRIQNQLKTLNPPD